MTLFSERLQDAFSSEFLTARRGRNITVFLEKAREVKFVGKAALMGDFVHGQDRVAEKFFREVEFGSDQVLVRGTAGDLPEDPAEMGIGNGKASGFFLEVPWMLGMEADFFLKLMDPVFAEGVDPGADARLFLKLEEEVFKHPRGAGKVGAAGVRKDLMERAERGVEAFRMDDRDERVFVSGEKKSAFEKTVDESAAETEETMVAEFVSGGAVVEFDAGAGDEGVGTFDGDRGIIADGEEEFSGMVVLDPVVVPEGADVRNAFALRVVSVGIEDKRFKVFHAERSPGCGFRMIRMSI